MRVSDKQIEKLRQREFRGEPLTVEEQATLDGYYQTIEATEAVYLTPAVEHLREYRQHQETILQQLEGLRETKRQRLAQIESLVREIESLGEEETRLLLSAKS